MPLEDHAPLAHRIVLIACSEMKAARLAGGLEALGATVQLLPVIAIREIEDKRALDHALETLQQYSWLLFTSAYAVRFFLGRADSLNLGNDALSRIPMCAIGPATGEALRQAGHHVALVPKEYVAEGVLAALAEFHGGMENLRGLRLLMPRALEARDLLPRALEAAGATVDVVPCYENTVPELDPERIESLLRNPPDWCVFTSSSAVNHFFTLVGSRAAHPSIANARMAVLGPITARALAEHGRQPDLVPEENTIPALLSALAHWKDDGVRS